MYELRFSGAAPLYPYCACILLGGLDGGGAKRAAKRHLAALRLSLCLLRILPGDCPADRDAAPLWRVARREGENLSSYVERNFAYLRVLSFGSDLFLKFIATAAVILAGRGDWVAPLLMIFTGDYLLQGRVFILPLRGALVFGLGCFVLGVVQLLWLEGSLVYPLSVFCAACLLSLLHSSRAAGVLPQEDDCVGGQHD
jgi:hypothetical protein